MASGNSGGKTLIIENRLIELSLARAGWVGLPGNHCLRSGAVDERNGNKRTGW